MKSIVSVEDLQNNLKKILLDVSKGKSYIISTSDKKEKLAKIIPFDSFKDKGKRELGTLKDKIKFNDKDFKTTEEIIKAFEGE